MTPNTQWVEIVERSEGVVTRRILREVPKKKIKKYIGRSRGRQVSSHVVKQVRDALASTASYFVVTDYYCRIQKKICHYFHIQSLTSVDLEAARVEADILIDAGDYPPCATGTEINFAVIGKDVVESMWSIH